MYIVRPNLEAIIMSLNMYCENLFGYQGIQIKSNPVQVVAILWATS